MAAVPCIPRARLLQLMKAQCQIFSTTYNPEGIRMGNKVLRQRLRGPALASYYPGRGPTINTIAKEFRSLELETENEEEDWRLEHIEGQVNPMLLASLSRRSRGKGAPKKKRTAPGTITPHPLSSKEPSILTLPVQSRKKPDKMRIGDLILPP
ncbi:mitochondrial ribosomal subunit S27-domain-containing protein [Astrocystis sublimbata]|nr:mitochondrial ribosomal subunit S27-domain-containing protein [Astrocystis sublimbata]